MNEPLPPRRMVQITSIRQLTASMSGATTQTPQTPEHQLAEAGSNHSPSPAAAAAGAQPLPRRAVALPPALVEESKGMSRKSSFSGSVASRKSLVSREGDMRRKALRPEGVHGANGEPIGRRSMVGKELVVQPKPRPEEPEEDNTPGEARRNVDGSKLSILQVLNDDDDDDRPPPVGLEAISDAIGSKKWRASVLGVKGSVETHQRRLQERQDVMASLTSWVNDVLVKRGGMSPRGKGSLSPRQAQAQTQPNFSSFLDDLEHIDAEQLELEVEARLAGDGGEPGACKPDPTGVGQQLRAYWNATVAEEVETRFNRVRERWDAEMAGEMAELGELRDKCKELRRQAKEYKEQYNSLSMKYELMQRQAKTSASKLATAEAAAAVAAAAAAPPPPGMDPAPPEPPTQGHRDDASDAASTVLTQGGGGGAAGELFRELGKMREALQEAEEGRSAATKQAEELRGEVVRLGGDREVMQEQLKKAQATATTLELKLQEAKEEAAEAVKAAKDASAAAAKSEAAAAKAAKSKPEPPPRTPSPAKGSKSGAKEEEAGGSSKAEVQKVQKELEKLVKEHDKLVLEHGKLQKTLEARAAEVAKLTSELKELKLKVSASHGKEKDKEKDKEKSGGAAGKGAPPEPPPPLAPPAPPPTDHATLQRLLKAEGDLALANAKVRQGEETIARLQAQVKELEGRTSTSTPQPPPSHLEVELEVERTRRARLLGSLQEGALARLGGVMGEVAGCRGHAADVQRVAGAGMQAVHEVLQALVHEFSVGLEVVTQAAPRTTRAGAAGRARRITLDTHDLQGLLANSTAKLQQLIELGGMPSTSLESEGGRPRATYSGGMPGSAEAPPAPGGVPPLRMRMSLAGGVAFGGAALHLPPGLLPADAPALQSDPSARSWLKGKLPFMSGDVLQGRLSDAGSSSVGTGGVTPRIRVSLQGREGLPSHIVAEMGVSVQPPDVNGSVRSSTDRPPLPPQHLSRLSPRREATQGCEPAGPGGHITAARIEAHRASLAAAEASPPIAQLQQVLTPSSSSTAILAQGGTSLSGTVPGAGQSSERVSGGRGRFQNVPGFVLERPGPGTGGGGGVRVRTVPGRTEPAGGSSYGLERPQGTTAHDGSSGSSRQGGTFERLHAAYLAPDVYGPGARGSPTDPEGCGAESGQGGARDGGPGGAGVTTPNNNTSNSKHSAGNMANRAGTAQAMGPAEGAAAASDWAGVPPPFGGLVPPPDGALPPDVFGVGRAEVLRGRGLNGQRQQLWGPQQLAEAAARVASSGAMLSTAAAAANAANGSSSVNVRRQSGRRPMSAMSASTAARNVDAEWRPLSGLSQRPGTAGPGQSAKRHTSPPSKSRGGSPDREGGYSPRQNMVDFLRPLPLEQQLAVGGPPPLASHNLYQQQPGSMPGAFRVRLLTATPQKGVNLGRRGEGAAAEEGQRSNNTMSLGLALEPGEGPPQVPPPPAPAMLSALTGLSAGLSVPMHGWALYPQGAPAGAQLHKPGDERPVVSGVEMMGRSELLGAVRAIQSQHMEVVGRYRAALGDLEEAERTRAELAAEVGEARRHWVAENEYNAMLQEELERMQAILEAITLTASQLAGLGPEGEEEEGEGQVDLGPGGGGAAHVLVQGGGSRGGQASGSGSGAPPFTSPFQQQQQQSDGTAGVDSGAGGLEPAPGATTGSAAGASVSQGYAASSEQVPGSAAKSHTIRVQVPEDGASGGNGGAGGSSPLSPARSLGRALSRQATLSAASHEAITPLALDLLHQVEELQQLQGEHVQHVAVLAAAHGLPSPGGSPGLRMSPAGSGVLLGSPGVRGLGGPAVWENMGE